MLNSNIEWYGVMTCVETIGPVHASLKIGGEFFLCVLKQPAHACENMVKARI